MLVPTSLTSKTITPHTQKVQAFKYSTNDRIINTLICSKKEYSAVTFMNDNNRFSAL